jgi:hypothetical protein
VRGGGDILGCTTTHDGRETNNSPIGVEIRIVYDKDDEENAETLILLFVFISAVL